MRGEGHGKGLLAPRVSIDLVNLPRLYLRSVKDVGYVPVASDLQPRINPDD